MLAPDRPATTLQIVKQIGIAPLLKSQADSPVASASAIEASCKIYHLARVLLDIASKASANHLREEMSHKFFVRWGTEAATIGK